MIEPTISCHNMRLEFKVDRKRKTVIDGADMVIPENSIVLLYGPTGTGKTTIFNALAGLNLCGVVQGDIYWGDQPVRNVDDANQMRPDFISLIYSHFYFLQSLNVKENICLPAIFAGKDRKYLRNRLELLADVFDFQEGDTSKLNFSNNILHSSGGNGSTRKNAANGPPNEVLSLSNGQREMVNIARAFILDTPFIFADELLRSYSDDEIEVLWNRILDPRLGIGVNKTLFMITRNDYFRHDPRVDLVYEIDGGSIKLNYSRKAS